MSVTKKPYPVTLAHEVFVPSHDAVRALSELFDDTDAAERHPHGLFTTSRRILDQYAFRAGQYETQIHEASRRLDREMARTALHFSGRVAEQTLHNGDARFYFEVTPQMKLDRAVHAMIPLGGLKERIIDGNSALYLDIAKESLAQSVTQRRNVLAEFKARALHPSSKDRMTASSPQIVTLDIDRYPLGMPPPVPVQKETRHP